MAVSVARVAIYLPSPGFKLKERTFKLYVFIRWDLNFCVNSSPLREKADETIPHITLTTPGICKLLKEIKPNKACGSDNTPNFVLKECVENLTPAIATIFQLSLNTGDLPEDWRSTKISSAYMKGEIHTPLKLPNLSHLH